MRSIEAEGMDFAALYDEKRQRFRIGVGVDHETLSASHYDLLAHHASECIGCKACEARCPFGVAIADQMKKACELFGY